jgi:transcriptional regulator GlxA family with amidase domain
MTPPRPRALSVGFVLMPNFTMLALSAFLDTLRLAADEGDRSRPIDCAWTLMSVDGRSVGPATACGSSPTVR